MLRHVTRKATKMNKRTSAGMLAACTRERNTIESTRCATSVATVCDAHQCQSISIDIASATDQGSRSTETSVPEDAPPLPGSHLLQAAHARVFRANLGSACSCGRCWKA